MIWQIASTTIALLVAYRFVLIYLTDQAYHRLASANGCREPRDITFSWPMMFARIRRVMNSRKTGEDIVDDIIVRDYDDAWTHTAVQMDSSRIIATTEPANLQALLATQFNDFATGELRYRALAPVLGRSIFSSDGAFWEHSRALFRPFFSREHINNLEATENAANTLIDVLELEASDNPQWTREVDMQPLLYNFTLDTATDFLFGESVNCQAAAMKKTQSKSGDMLSDEASTSKFNSDFNHIARCLQTRVQLGDYYWLSDGFKFRKAIKNVRAVIEHFADQAIKTRHSEEVENISKTDRDYLLSSLARETQDRRDLCNQTLALLAAGRDTTAALLSWCVVQLALNPDIFASLRKTILEHFGKGGDEPLTFSNLKSCRYLQHFLNEVLRVNTLVPFNARVAVRDTTLPVGGGPDRKSPIGVPKGTSVLYSVYVMHRRKDLWGEDALDFKPERWDKKVFPAWQFLPFSGGPRICLGQQFALTEAGLLLVRLLQRYDAIEAVDRARMAKMRKGVGLTMYPIDGVKVKLHKAGE